MDHPKRTRLYKYTSFNARSISTLATGKIWFPKPNTVNDPFDCTIVNHSLGIPPSLEKKRREIKSAMRQSRPDKSAQSDIERKIFDLHDKALSTITKQEKEFVSMSQEAYASLQSHIHSSGILSLSATPRNILMWSHYGAHHTGICFEFERRANNKLGTDAKPVTYSRSREITDQGAQDEIWNLFFVKYGGWRYEQEWRLLEEKGNQLYDFPGRLIAVICGAQMPDQNISATKMIVDSLNVNRIEKIIVKYAWMSEKHYSISIRETKRTNE